ncbi:hypothetical protein EYF80_046889 [Liparis tanakae]|uniref:Uncharacterized protein n=1 Tax=Liparis tanakae TaxID=230148 RepID=A0A4Z2FNV4_9TELE|nr:hypothetical protein EYF80_046889 [Liparis tanakae]
MELGCTGEEIRHERSDSTGNASDTFVRPALILQRSTGRRGNRLTRTGTVMDALSRSAPR